MTSGDEFDDKGQKKRAMAILAARCTSQLDNLYAMYCGIRDVVARGSEQLRCAISRAKICSTDFYAQREQEQCTKWRGNTETDDEIVKENMITYI